MLQEDQCMEIALLRQQGKSIRKIARLLNVSPNTVRKYLKEGKKLEYSPRVARPRKLDPYKDYIQERLQFAKPGWIPATVIYREIQSLGYTGRLRQLRYFMSGLKPPERLETVIRFETAPGKQMQVDWAYFREGKVKLYAFIATLGYSRASYVEFTEDMTLETLLYCHRQAFEYVGGSPEEILYDNMKTVVIERNAYGSGQHRLHPRLYDFAKHYRFIPRLCKPYRAQTKGKVERFIRYLRESFFVPLIATLRAAHICLDKETANTEVRKWLSEVAHQRIHQTLRIKPVERLSEDICALQALPPNAYPADPYTPSMAIIQKVAPVPATLPHLRIEQHPLSIYDALTG